MRLRTAAASRGDSQGARRTGGNWVRVGDPNQAIYETFDGKSRFPPGVRGSVDVVSLELPNSGRSIRNVIDLANALIAWTTGEHPVPELPGRSRQAPYPTGAAPVTLAQSAG